MSTTTTVLSEVFSFMATRKQLLIDGKWQDAASGKTFKVENPANGDDIAEVAYGDKTDIDLAVKSARKAFDTGAWGKTSASARAKMLWKLADLIDTHATELAQLESLDNGKSCGVAKAADVPLASEIFRSIACKRSSRLKSPYI